MHKRYGASIQHPYIGAKKVVKAEVKVEPMKEQPKVEVKVEPKVEAPKVEEKK